MGRPVDGVCTKSIESGIRYKPEPCVGTSSDPDHMYCLPSKADKCPITKVTFSEDPTTKKLQIETSTDPIYGLPIIQLALSQGG